MQGQNILTVNNGRPSAQAAPGQLEVVRAFLNTWRIPHDTREPADALTAADDLRRFQSAHLPDLRGPLDLAAARELRDDLRRALGDGDVAAVGRRLAVYPVVAALTVDREGKAAVRYEPGPSPCALCGALLAIVVEAVALRTWPRLKACPDCRWVFYDHTKSATKVWCAMNALTPTGRACGSIAKVRRWRGRQKAAAQDA